MIIKSANGKKVEKNNTKWVIYMSMHYNYEIKLNLEEEIVSTIGGRSVTTKNIPVIITSAVIEGFYSLLHEVPSPSEIDIERAMLNTMKLLGCKPRENENWTSYEDDVIETFFHYERLSCDGEIMSVLLEVKALNYALQEWVSCLDLKPKLSFENDLAYETFDELWDAPFDAEFLNNPSAMAIYLFQNALCRAKSEPVIIPELNRFETKVSSDGILDLAWYEIFFILDHRIPRILSCPYCGTIYQAPSNNPEKQHCGAVDCGKKYLVASHGGIEGYREWERTRKKKQIPGKKPVGRPSKQNLKDGV